MGKHHLLNCEYGVGLASVRSFPGTHRHGNRSCFQHPVLHDADDEADIRPQRHQARRCLTGSLFLETRHIGFSDNDKKASSGFKGGQIMIGNQPQWAQHRKLWVSFGIAFMLMGTSTVALAHAAVLWAYVENNHVYVEAFFVGGAKVKNGRIVVVDAKGKKLLEGKTDPEGKFDFAPPIFDDMTILLLLDKAHGSDFKIKKQDFNASDNVTLDPAVLPSPRPE
jgi:hypothetical protein